MTKDKVKYPRTMHLPWSPGLQNDDRMIQNMDAFVGKEVVVTEKLDGENTTMYRFAIHARSIDGRYHPSRDWVTRFWGERQFMIPPGSRVCGENVYAQHSIVYDDLETYFYGFGYWDGNTCLDWDSTLFLFDRYDMKPVPTLWRGEYNEETLKEIASGLDPDKQEGFVVRLVESFEKEDFDKSVAKYVRAGHVQTDEHWMHGEVKKNLLAS